MIEIEHHQKANKRANHKKHGIAGVQGITSQPTRVLGFEVHSEPSGNLCIVIYLIILHRSRIPPRSTLPVSILQHASVYSTNLQHPLRYPARLY